jgi:UDP-2,3-diacylglucosamine pyrophosphatase LpxH
MERFCRRQTTPPPMSTETSQRTIVLSDLHLGRRGSAAQSHRFARLIATHRRVIVNGDVAELHHGEFRSAAEEELARFRELCARSETRLDLVAGNHDPFVSNIRSLTLCEGSVYLTHGDAFHPAIAPWSPYAAAMESAFRKALAESAGDRESEVARLAAAREAAVAEWQALGDGAHISTIASMAVRPHRALAAIRYWRRYPNMARDWASRFAPHADTLVVGHSHRPFVTELDGVRIVNTGAYGFPGRPLAVVIDGRDVAVHRIEMDERLFRLREQPLARWTTGAVDTAQSQRASESFGADATERASTRRMNAAASASADRSTDVR